MTAESFLARLERIKETGPGRYIASCPGHDDRNPSLAVRVLDDGRVLVHCFGGCGVQDIVGAVGMTVAGLFPDRPPTQTTLPTKGLKLKPAEALMLLGHEIVAANLIVHDLVTILRRGEMPSELALSRLAQCSGRIQTVRGVTEAITPPELVAIRRGLAA